jgi:hypothetical protein
MYGTHLAVNHLLVAEKFQIKKADQLLDQSTTNTNQHDLARNNRLHLHCWHTERRFSKFQFKAGAYNRIHPRTLLNDSSAQAYVLPPRLPRNTQITLVFVAGVAHGVRIATNVVGGARATFA